MSVNWRHVARKDFEDAVRSKLLWGITAAFVGLLVLIAVASYVGQDGDLEPLGTYTFLGQMNQFFVPLVALIVGYMAIVGERQSGSLRVLLSYPFSRGAIVGGKVVGRVGVMAAAILAGFAVMTAITLALIGVPPVVETLQIVGLTLALGVTFTAIGVGISAATATRGTAMALAVGCFFVLLVLWEAVAVGLYYLAYGARPELQVETWYLFVRQLNPIEAYRVAVAAVADEFVWPMITLGLEDIPTEAAVEARMASNRIDGETPFYLSPWATSVTFLLWTAIPLLIGYRRFRNSDLE